MFFLLAFFSLSSLNVEINGKAIVADDLQQAVIAAGCDNNGVQSIVVFDGEINLDGIMKSYPDLQILKMEGSSRVAGGKVPDNCFSKSNIREVTLRGVQSIGNDAFSRCSFLTKFSAPSLTDIGLRSFQDCVSLISFTFPYGVKTLPKTVLHGCDSLTNLTIEGQVFEIPEYFFSGLPHLKFVSIPSSVKNFESPFSPSVNVSLIRPGNYCPPGQSYEVPRFALQLGHNLFNGCDQLQHIFVHEKIQTVGKYAFANMPHLINVTFQEPSSLHHINDYSFSNSSLQYITFPASLRSNGKQCFAKSMRLKRVFVHSTYDFEWMSEGMIADSTGIIEELPAPKPDQEKLHGLPRFTPCPLRPKQKPLTDKERELYTPKKSANQKKENIIFFFSDQQRWDTIGPNGQKLDITPNIDQLAREGVNFRNCFTNQPVCGPVRAVIQSGVYATETGCFKNAVPLPDNQPHRLADELKKAGYSLAYIGKWHLASDQGSQRYEQVAVPLKYRGGWDEYWVAADVIEFTSHGYGGYLFDQDMNKREFTGYRVDSVTDFALEYIRNYDDEEKPFALFLSHLEPHHQNDHNSFEGPTGSKEKFKDFEQPADLTKGKGDWERWMPDYLGCCNSLDKNLGRVVEALKEKGIYDDTMIIYTSDHGCHFKSHPEDVELGGSDDYKRSSYESALHIPFVVKGRDFYGGENSDRIISSIDFPPTLVRAAGGEIPSNWKGRPIQEYKSADWKDYMYSQVSESYVGRLVRTDRWKYVIHAAGKAPFGDPGSDKDTWTDKHLFDLKNDPTEKHDLKDNADYNEIKAQLRQLLIDCAYRAGEGNFTISDQKKSINNDL
ncbi:hypothetical protein M9Y10_031690 [Tritrichomonas musculus]|uniref:Sulfatase N-terminal domain-containing protein n=1 Tax=Tritrichomonas musculus TaxID=1915356 RepID=A0ABR2H279_9EUKA